METVTYSLWPIPYLSPKAQLKTNRNTQLHEIETESLRGVLAFGSSLNFPGRWLLLISIYKFPAEPGRVAKKQEVIPTTLVKGLATLRKDFSLSQMHNLNLDNFIQVALLKFIGSSAAFKYSYFYR